MTDPDAIVTVDQLEAAGVAVTATLATLHEATERREAAGRVLLDAASRNVSGDLLSGYAATYSVAVDDEGRAEAAFDQATRDGQAVARRFAYQGRAGVRA